jgi:hypothetical protein
MMRSNLVATMAMNGRSRRFTLILCLAAARADMADDE